MLDRLFVYGTLRSEFSNSHALQLRREARMLGRATTQGVLYRFRSFPGFDPDDPGLVRGELYRLFRPHATLRILDEYEGKQFPRVVIDASLADGRRVTAWIYRYRGSTGGRPCIISGDFCGS